MRSASCTNSGRAYRARSLSRLIVPRVVSPPVFSTRTWSAPSMFMLPAATSSPTLFCTGRASPVSKASSTLLPPSTTLPSAGTASPGRTRTTSPATRRLDGIVSNPAAVVRDTVGGSTLDIAVLRSIERCLARISRKRPSVRKNTNITTESNQTAGAWVSVAYTEPT